MGSLLFGVRPNDTPTYVCTALVLGLSALAATLLPAKKACHTEPMSALRAD
jgi:ABC-type lipoprotein release transport system permease subunit